jgi:hypothetical protein
MSVIVQQRARESGKCPPSLLSFSSTPDTSSYAGDEYEFDMMVIRILDPTGTTLFSPVTAFAFS